MDTQSWGYRRTMKVNEVLTPSQIIQLLVVTVACGKYYLHSTHVHASSNTELT